MPTAQYKLPTAKDPLWLRLFWSKTGSTDLEFLCVQKNLKLWYYWHCYNCYNCSTVSMYSMPYTGGKQTEELLAKSPLINSNPTLSLINIMKFGSFPPYTTQYSKDIFKRKRWAWESKLLDRAFCSQNSSIDWSILTNLSLCCPEPGSGLPSSGDWSANRKLSPRMTGMCPETWVRPMLHQLIILQLLLPDHIQHNTFLNF